MKKLICALLAVVMLFTLCACGGETKEEPKTTEATNAPAAEKGYVFENNGVEVAVNAAPDAVISALGEPVDTAEEASCAFEGKDITYFYNDFEILVAAPAGADSYISSVVIKSDAVSTPEGLEIGMAQSKVTELYGDCAFDDPLYIYKKGNMQLRIKCVDDVVTAIEYATL